MSGKQRLLLHVCCGPCATHPLNVLREQYAVTLFFSNSNIAPREEYERRLDAVRELAKIRGITLVEDVYRHDLWLDRVRGLEKEREGGRRCEVCFAYNLGRTAEHAERHGFGLFTTTLTVSPHKRTEILFRVGRNSGSFLAVDFKKQDGFRRAVELTRSYGLYRQSYCGCEFSHEQASE